LRIITLNANGIRAANRKGFFAWLEAQNADVVCIQETKAHRVQLDETFFPLGYHIEYVDAQKKGYSGVAIYSRHQPNHIITSMNYELSDNEGRYLRYDFDNFSVMSLYLPSGTSGDERQTFKYAFCDEFEKHLLALKAEGRPCIICGDLNIVHKEIDIRNWKANQKNSGCLPEERAWLDKLFDELGFIDAFREVNQEDEQYTWWSNRGQSWAKNVGWRIDYQLISDSLKGKVKSASIYKEERFSDHAPLIIDYDLQCVESKQVA
jgi:exodeoxyribonuclease-3